MMTGRVTELSPFVWGERPVEKDDALPPNHADSDSDQSQASGNEDKRLRRRRKAWTSERLRKIIQRESVEWMGVKFNVSM